MGFDHTSILQRKIPLLSSPKTKQHKAKPTNKTHRHTKGNTRSIEHTVENFELYFETGKKGSPSAGPHSPARDSDASTWSSDPRTQHKKETPQRQPLSSSSSDQQITDQPTSQEPTKGTAKDKKQMEKEKMEKSKRKKKPRNNKENKE